VGKVTKKQLQEIAKLKEKDLNARDIDHACRIIAGTARSMGVEVEYHGQARKKIRGGRREGRPCQAVRTRRRHRRS
jgi:hypothetical protein